MLEIDADCVLTEGDVEREVDCRVAVGLREAVMEEISMVMSVVVRAPD